MTGGGTFEALGDGGPGAAGSNVVPAGFNNEGWSWPLWEGAKGAGSAFVSGLGTVANAAIRAPYVMIHDTITMPIDAAMGTQYSYAAEANAQRLRRGDSAEEITADTYRSITTFGIADWLDGVDYYVETGDPVPMQEAAGAMLGGAAAAELGEAALGELEGRAAGRRTAGAPRAPDATSGESAAARTAAIIERVPLCDPAIGPVEAATERSLLTSHPDAHAFDRHGGGVTNAQLETRARTGVAPDGSSVVKNGQTKVPPYSSAFHSDELLIEADQAIRNGPLQAKIAADPAATVHRVDGFDVGKDLGRGYARIGGATYNPGTQGPLQLHEGLTKATGIYEKNAATGVWETITIWPEP